MFQTAVLASGSKGNCSLVRTNNTVLLIDAGLSFAKTCAAINKLTLSPETIDAVIISHEHSDHIKGIGPLCRKLKVPVYITEPTYDASRLKKERAKIPSEIHFFSPGDYFSVGDLEVHAFSSSHDAVDACNFTIVQKTALSRVNAINANGTLPTVNSGEPPDIRKLAIATDLGFCTRLLINKIKDATTVILESNHDSEMLMTGRYPWHLKQRVKSINGHLSNDQAIGLLSQIMHPRLDNLILAHLSEENNHPGIVEQVFSDYLFSVRCNTRLAISKQSTTTPLIDV